jgi:hypothetical protein
MYSMASLFLAELVASNMMSSFASGVIIVISMDDAGSRAGCRQRTDHPTWSVTCIGAYRTTINYGSDPSYPLRDDIAIQAEDVEMFGLFASWNSVMALHDGKAKCRITGSSCGDTCFNEHTTVGRLAGDNKKLLVVIKMKKHLEIANTDSASRS